VTHSGLSRTQAEALGVFLLGPEMQARFVGYDTYDIAEGDEAAVRIPGATFRVLLDHGYLEPAAPEGAMLRWRISSAGRAALRTYPQ
jgi:hypothetical protein